jgi:hypothetical protein
MPRSHVTLDSFAYVLGKHATVLRKEKNTAELYAQICTAKCALSDQHLASLLCI